MGGDLLLLIAIIGPFALFGWAAIRAKHRGLGGAFAGPFQDMFDPGAARAQIVIEERAELPDPADSGDPDNEDEAPNTAVYRGGRFYINPDKARWRGAIGPPGGLAEVSPGRRGNGRKDQTMTGLLRMPRPAAAGTRLSRWVHDSCAGRVRQGL
jgi:hypothetical protein